MKRSAKNKDDKLWFKEDPNYDKNYNTNPKAFKVSETSSFIKPMLDIEIWDECIFKTFTSIPKHFPLLNKFIIAMQSKLLLSFLNMKII